MHCAWHQVNKHEGNGLDKLYHSTSYLMEDIKASRSCWRSRSTGYSLTQLDTVNKSHEESVCTKELCTSLGGLIGAALLHKLSPEVESLGPYAPC